MKKLALFLPALALLGCSKADWIKPDDTPYMRWHKLQGELIHINDEESAKCQKTGKAWGFLPNTNIGPMCVDVPKQETPAAVKK